VLSCVQPVCAADVAARHNALRGSDPNRSLAITLGLTAWLLPVRGEQATAQSGPLHILVVEYDIVPGEIENYLTPRRRGRTLPLEQPD
jgi:hypothetical protein